MPARNRDTATYGYAHRKRTAQLKAAMRDGDPCARGGEPMYRWQLDLHRHHPRSIHGEHLSTPVALGGALPDALSCLHHNCSHGARLGNRLKVTRRGARRRTLPTW